jgi:hypothetical protein
VKENPSILLCVMILIVGIILGVAGGFLLPLLCRCLS